jgi:hypothetical protein
LIFLVFLSFVEISNQISNKKGRTKWIKKSGQQHAGGENDRQSAFQVTTFFGKIIFRMKNNRKASGYSGNPLTCINKSENLIKICLTF